MFADRRDAGDRLAELLANEGVTADVVLGVPRGGLPVAARVADRLGAPLDVVAAKKMGAPNNPEYAIGAAAGDGSVWLNRDAIDRLGVPESYVERERERAAETARGKEATYREAPELDLDGKAVVVVDDGVATGATMTACLRKVREAGASRVMMAVPVGPPDTLDRLAGEADDVFCVLEPADFRAVGQFYRRFDQVSDEEARSYLE